jgi:dienelactone hydrolase
METTKTRFAFTSEGETLVGNLFLPEESQPAGVVVAVGPLTSVKEQAAGTYAGAMAERGYAALAFDYRYFGESSGLPRQFENPDANIEDIKNAATALLADERLTDLPLFGLGVCFGAGPMVFAWSVNTPATPAKARKRESSATGFCASPLTDSNRRPPPYHGSSQRVAAYMAGHSQARLSCKSTGEAVSAMPALARACPT